MFDRIENSEFVRSENMSSEIGVEYCIYDVI